MTGVNGIEITEIKITPVTRKQPGELLEAHATITLNGTFRIHNIRLIAGKFGPFISWPLNSGRENIRGNS